MFHVKQFTSKTQKIGEIGEEKASMFLVKQGFDIVERNISNKFGEIDIVAKKGGVHYFFEVKTGKSGGWIHPAENLTREKLRKFCISAEYYCMIKGVTRYVIQGVIVLLGETGEATVEIVDIS